MIDYDTPNLRHNAEFRTLIHKELYWVPVNSLGKTRYSRQEAVEIGLRTLEEKLACVSNLYEAIQLFQSCNFEDRKDEEYLDYKGLLWEYHKSGSRAANDNFGNCSAIASWLNLFLKGVYEETGYLFFSRPDGTGHVINYIRHHGWYYIIDLSSMTTVRAGTACPESGKKVDYIRSKYVTGICFTTQKLECFAHYHSRIQRYNNFDFLYLRLPSSPAFPALAVEQEMNRIVVHIMGSYEVVRESGFVFARRAYIPYPLFTV